MAAQNQKPHSPDEVNKRHHPWTNHAITYRAKEIQVLANWILTGANGSLIGISGSGKSDLLGFLCHRPEALKQYLPPSAQPVTILPMDLNTLPDPTLSALFRVILRAFYEHQNCFAPASQEVIQTIYIAHRGQADPFLAQSGVRELLIHLQQQRHRVVFALDGFDSFSAILTPEMGDNLRGLRDGFKETLSFIACMNHSFAYLPNRETLGDLRRLLDQQVCFVGPLNEQDARNIITRRVAVAVDKPTEKEIAHICFLTGGYPSLVMLVCRWWLTTTNKPAVDEWLDPDTETLYHGQQLLNELAPKERTILHFFAEQPYVQHTYTDIIIAGWTDEENYDGVTNESLFQVIRTLRQKIEPIPSKPVYVLNWRGQPEGGYQFFPEGKPN